ncbi:hypothetical protein DN752_06985 [Echinicola strongylocentroti]|uniref:Glycosyltransferase 2-like domain-containing protein n=1 Tax=Echinicola strongylocentroti TaxID=1795355 RepID=A0A2Z4IFL6_9BACT|nr:glycosyltransferase [Echinicola strongylocentroti]AWW29882.1 hypothetical protein DN752_06985 [Echinicola strongylocentroti]
MNLLPIFFFAALAVYLLVLVLLSSKWKRPKATKMAVEGGVDYPVSLLVPFRNEKENLPGLLQNLANLSYPNLQVILINDHSEDGSDTLARQWIEAEKKSNFKLVDSQGVGKKAAMEHGVVMANANIILTTDADCALPADWVQNMLRAFDDPKVQMVAGPVVSSANGGVFEYFQQIEWASILLMTNFFFRTRKPIMCSAANMGYRKEAFYHLGGYQGNSGQMSGDDSYLLEKMLKRFGHQSIRYVTASKVLVKTKPSSGWRVFLNQRSRWASKWNKHQFLGNAIGAVASIGFSLVSIGTVILLFGGGGFVVMFAIYWFLKIIFEYFSLNKVLKTYQVKPPMTSFVFASFCHPVYVLGVAFASFFVPSKWRGRRSTVGA